MDQVISQESAAIAESPIEDGQSVGSAIYPITVYHVGIGTVTDCVPIGLEWVGPHASPVPL
jgi:hypothetical protein